MDSNFVAVGRFSSLMSAQFYQSLLRERGIDSFIPNECLAGLRPYDLLLGDIEILVPRSYEDEARGVLAEMAERVSEESECQEESGLDGEAEEEFSGHEASATDPFDQDELPPVMDERRNGIHAHLALVIFVALAMGVAYIIAGIVSAL